MKYKCINNPKNQGNLPHLDLDMFIWATSRDDTVEDSLRRSYSDVLNWVSNLVTVLLRFSKKYIILDRKPLPSKNGEAQRDF